MADKAATVAKRRGRPPDRDSAETWRAIVDAARRLFAERGYAAVTNKDLAAAAGVTPGALYHYMESKLDLYVAVHRDMQRNVYRRFVEAVEGSATFIGQLEAVLEAAHELNGEDPSIAIFVGTVRVDMRRFPELEERLAASAAGRDEFFTSIVDAGVVTGEVCAANRDMVAEFLRVMLVGLTEGVTKSTAEHRLAIDSIRALVRGELLKPPTPPR